MGGVCSTLEFISHVRYVEHIALLPAETNIEYYIYVTCILDSSSKTLRCVHCPHFTHRKLRFLTIEQYAWNLNPNYLTQKLFSLHDCT